MARTIRPPDTPQPLHECRMPIRESPYYADSTTRRYSNGIDNAGWVWQCDCGKVWECKGIGGFASEWNLLGYWDRWRVQPRTKRTWHDWTVRTYVSAYLFFLVGFIVCIAWPPFWIVTMPVALFLFACAGLCFLIDRRTFIRLDEDDPRK